MSWREEGTDIVIDGFDKGITDSPFNGFVEQSYGSISNTPGEFSAQFPLTTSTLTAAGGQTLGVPIQIATQLTPTSGSSVVKYILLDSKGQIWTSSTSGSTVTWTYRANPDSVTTSTVGNSGIVWWKGYALMLRGAKIWYSNATNFDSWTDWSGTVGNMVTGVSHYAISGVDDAAYFCNGSSVGSILEKAGSSFDPTSSTTYTINLSALKLPSYDISTCLAELQDAVLVGATLNRIYNWNRVATSFTNIIYLAEQYVQRMVTTNTNTYVFCGNSTIPNGRGYIYITNGTQIDVFKKMPDFFPDLLTPPIPMTHQEPYWVFGDAMFHRNMLVFGCQAYTNGTTTALSFTGGIWAIDITSKSLFRLNRFVASESKLATVLSANNTGTSLNGLSYIAGYDNVMNNATATVGQAAIVSSDMIPVGTFLNKRTFDNVEVKLSFALGASDALSISYISDVESSGTIGSMTSADGIGAVFPVTFQNSQWLQIYASLTPGGTSTFCRIREIRLRKST